MKNWGKRGTEETAGAKASSGSKPGVPQESKAAVPTWLVTVTAEDGEAGSGQTVGPCGHRV